jgi:hypothetical protein
MISEFKKSRITATVLSHSFNPYLHPHVLYDMSKSLSPHFTKPKKRKQYALCSYLERVMILHISFNFQWHIILLKMIKYIDSFSYSINHMHTVASDCFYVPRDNALLVSDQNVPILT